MRKGSDLLVNNNRIFNYFKNYLLVEIRSFYTRNSQQVDRTETARQKFYLDRPKICSLKGKAFLDIQYFSFSSLTTNIV